MDHRDLHLCHALQHALIVLYLSHAHIGQNPDMRFSFACLRNANLKYFSYKDIINPERRYTLINMDDWIKMIDSNDGEIVRRACEIG